MEIIKNIMSKHYRACHEVISMAETQIFVSEYFEWGYLNIFSPENYWVW